MEITEEELAAMVAKAVEDKIAEAIEAKADAIRSEVVAHIEEDQSRERSRMMNAMADQSEVVVVDPKVGYSYAVVPLAKIEFNEYSKRTEDELNPQNEEIKALAENIRKSGGLLRPLLVYRKDDGYVLVKGAKRLVALRAMGEESVHAYILPHKPPFALEETWVNGY